MAATMNENANVVFGITWCPRMKMDRRSKLMIAILAALFGGRALAAPPTVVPSPGYDARLQESRKAMATTSDQSVAPARAPVAPRHNVRRKHAH
jgi:hypothetical protein